MQRRTRQRWAERRVLASIWFAAKPGWHITAVSLAFLLTFVAIGFFVPLASSADEAAHYVYAAAVVRGQAGLLEPTLPAAIDNIHAFATCIAFHPEVTAACQLVETTESAESAVLSQTNAGLYNPVFYVWTGLGSLMFPTEAGLYASRVLATIVSSLTMGWGVSMLLRHAKTIWPSVAVFLLLTPMTLYVGGVLNPSAWEIVAMFAVMVSGWRILHDARTRPAWTEAHSLFLISGSILIVARGLSPLWFGIGCVVLMIAAGRKRVTAMLSASLTWIMLAPLIAIAGASALWVYFHGTNYVGIERPANLMEGLRSIPIFYSAYFEQAGQMYGKLGWLDIPSLPVLILAWVFLLGGFVLLSLGSSGTRAQVAIILAFAALTIIPGVLTGLQWSGVGWQGRYSLPLLAMVLVACALAVDRAFSASPEPTPVETGQTGFFGVVVPLFFLVGVAATTVRVVRRYLFGEPAPVLAELVWSPPVPGALLAIAFTVGVLALTALVRFSAPTRVAV